jgi:copper transport protein
VPARGVAFVLALLASLAHAPHASAHASLVKAEPADGAVIALAPAELRLRFNEPVSPLVMRLIGPSGEPIALGAVVAENASVAIATPGNLRRGTHVLSWRVISADGHPVGGTLIFSIGAPSAKPAAEPSADPSVRAALWAAKVAIYTGLFIGVGGAFFRAWIGDASAPSLDTWLSVLIVTGLLATAISVGLQGLDALDLPLSGLAQKVAWKTGLDTSYGMTAIAAAFAMFAGLFTFAAKSTRVARSLALAGLLGVGLALALSGHASNAAPRLISWLAVFLHGVCVMFWIGSLLPLLAVVRAAPSDAPVLARFSRAIPLPLTLLVASGLWLAVVQLERLDALWSTSYGQVLCCKLAAVLALIGLGAANRYRLVPRFSAQGAAAAPPLERSIAFELAIALAILALVALWRFTPPPRALITAPISFHIHGSKAMADVKIERERAAPGRVSIVVLDGEFQPLAAKEVTLVLASPAAGIEPMRRVAARAGENTWWVDELRVPVEGRWNLRLDILVGDFEKLMIEDTVALPRMP